MPGWMGLARQVAGWFGPRWQARLESRWLGLYLVRRRLRVVLAVYGPTGAALFPVCRRIRLPLVTEFLGYDASHRSILRTHRKTYRPLLEQEAATVAVSGDIERRLYELGARPGSVHTIACGVDAHQFQGAEPAANPPVFLAAGRFVEKKGPHLTLLAFSRLLADVPDARLVMVGGGPLLASSYQLADALGIRDAVDFAGYLSHEALAERMRGARAFVQHSIIAPSGDSEGMPVAILEAGASGLPVVATRHGGIPDAVIDGETGLLVDEGDVDAMADRMRRLALDPALAARLGAQARVHIAQHFEMSDTVGRLWGVLQLAMAGDTRRSGG
jgi:glycosyltransferase involved in cell wall biosynthesis